MSNPDWGAKRTCQNCGVKYYDLKRSPIACPKCGSEFNPDALLKSRRRPPAPKPAGTEKKVAAKAAISEGAPDEGLAVLEKDDDLEDLAEGDDENDVMEDTSELGEDDDMSDVVIGSDDGDDDT